MKTHTKTSFALVTIPTTKSAPGAMVKVPFAENKGDAVNAALALHRDRHGLPPGFTAFAKVEFIPLQVGTTVESLTGDARFKGKAV